MNDSELITQVREPFDGVRMTMPLDTVVEHGRVIRRRRRRRALAGTAAVTAGLATTVALLIPGGQAGPAKPGTAMLTAWTVTRDRDGGVTVEVRQMKDPAGLQAMLRGDGIPARVTFNPQISMTPPLPAGCRAPKMSGTANAHLQNKILTPPAELAYDQHMLAKSKREGARGQTPPGSGVYQWSAPAWVGKEAPLSELYINPAAIPRGIGLYVAVDAASPQDFSFGVDLTVTSPRCTGP
jgi:hypothetical protein